MAFPSISRAFLLEALTHVGFPTPALRVVQSLYADCTCDLRVNGVGAPGYRLD